MSRLEDCVVIDLPKVTDRQGNLTFLEGGRHIPFDVQRIFFIYDVPSGAGRGAHAHRTLHQFLVCLSGSFEVELDDGRRTTTVRLNRPWRGLHVPPLIWASEINFDPGTVCLVLASAHYDESDYIRNHEAFLATVQSA